MKYFRFRNWDKAQHYSEPNPPWAKIYAKILDFDNDWYHLSDIESGQLVRLIALACRRDNALPFDNDFIASEINASHPVNLEVFLKLGIIETYLTRAECIDIERLRTQSRKKSRINPREKTIPPRSEIRDQSSEDRDQKKDTERASSVLKSVRTGTPGPALDAAMLLAEQIKANDPHAKTPPNIEPWVIEIQRLHSTDGRPWPEIEAVIRWALQDDFWRGTILDARTLRKNFGKLVAQSKRTGAPVSKEDQERQAVQARNAAFRLLKGELAAVFSRDGPEVAGQWIEDQDASYRAGLTGRLTEMVNQQQEATA